jgi:hypothetical protein
MMENIMSNEDVFNGVGVEVALIHPDDFLKVKETLSRMGIASYKTKTLWQSCHILHKKGRYAIVHFKEMFQLDGRPTDISEEDIARRNKIAKMLEEWELVRLIDNVGEIPLVNLKTIRYNEKEHWTLVEKYQIGGK